MKTFKQFQKEIFEDSRGRPSSRQGRDNKEYNIQKVPDVNSKLEPPIPSAIDSFSHGALNALSLGNINKINAVHNAFSHGTSINKELDAENEREKQMKSVHPNFHNIGTVIGSSIPILKGAQVIRNSVNFVKNLNRIKAAAGLTAIAGTNAAIDKGKEEIQNPDIIKKGIDFVNNHKDEIKNFSPYDPNNVKSSLQKTIGFPDSSENKSSDDKSIQPSSIEPKSIDKSVQQKPIEKSIEKPIEKPINRSIQKSVSKPVEKEPEDEVKQQTGITATALRMNNGLTRYASGGKTFDIQQ